MKHDLLKIGLITSPHGVRGEMNVKPLTDDPSRFLKVDSAYILDTSGNVIRSSRIVSVRIPGNKVVVKFEGVETPESARSFSMGYIAVDRENAVKLSEGSYFICDIIGCEVLRENGTTIGTITDVIETGASDLYSVQRKDMRNLLIPAVKEFVISVDTEKSKVVVRLPEGLEDL